MVQEVRDVAWVTGGYGFIGRHLCRALNRQGYRVSALGHGTWPEAEAAQWGIENWFRGDITASNLGEMLTHSGPPSVVFHLAGGSSVGQAIAQPHEDFVRTVNSSAILLEWVRQSSPHSAVIAVSSAAVYGAGHSGPIREDATLHPYSPYGYHKLMMETLCRSYGDSFGVKSVIPRLFSVFGSGLKKQLLWDLCGKLASGSETVVLGGTGDEIRDWIHVEDAVEAIILCKEQASRDCPAINIASGSGLSVSAVAEGVSSAWRERTGVLPEIRFSGQSRPGDPFSLIADTSRLASIPFALKTNPGDGWNTYVDWYLSLSKENM